MKSKRKEIIRDCRKLVGSLRDFEHFLSSDYRSFPDDYPELFPSHMLKFRVVDDSAVEMGYHKDDIIYVDANSGSCFKQLGSTELEESVAYNRPLLKLIPEYSLGDIYER